MQLSLAEEYLLLALDDTSGRPLLSTQYLQLGLAGAAAADLALHGVLTVSDGTDGGRKGRFRSTGRAAPADPVLRDVLTTTEGRTPQDAVGKAGQGTTGRRVRETLLDRLAAGGVLRAEQAKVLGLFPTTRWPAHDAAPEAAVRARLLDALIGRTAPDERTAALVSLLLATDLVRKVYPDQDRRALRRRAKEIADSQWAGAAVKKAVDALTAATTAVLVATTSATS
ncbi:GPP34 family phosphoprotein [Promicromonospora thailandica]|uniref:Golgi phosphoprotein 3 (GPP34) n=1 Tax=Promicromonospora thailandica TaxID=765201 RepID=A0A9X2G831_9MICO|nr:GPP34 family phosphoprotein [Promicromonospora thailandica]MCP2263661.1 Golgi phosphoprotein 3 (GPP34) [Promicromonospora thailandica]BFF19138.1 GPP34 family phosphoprotein [Promicromonospora thailandica]